MTAAGLGAAIALFAGAALAAAHPCPAGAQRQRVAIELSAPEAQHAISVVALIGYNSSVLRLPESGGSAVLRKRVTGRDRDVMLTLSDSGDALRLVAAKAGGLTPGALADVEFDRCAGAPGPAAADVRCTVESCAGSGGPIADCKCTIVWH